MWKLVLSDQFLKNSNSPKYANQNFLKIDWQEQYLTHHDQFRCKFRLNQDFQEAFSYDHLVIASHPQHIFEEKLSNTHRELHEKEPEYESQKR